MQRISRTRYAILGFLTWRPMSGYDIKKAVQQSTANFWSESYGQIYPILQQMVRDGLARRVSEAEGGRARQLYGITAKGRRELRRWLGEPTEVAPLRNEMLLKLFFGRQADAAVHHREITRLRQKALEGAGHLRGLRELLEANSALPDAPYWLLTLRFGELQSRVHLEWCDEALALFEKLAEPAKAGAQAPRRRKPPLATARRSAAKARRKTSHGSRRSRT